MENNGDMKQLSRAITAGKRTYYFDLNETREQEKYLTITEVSPGMGGTVERHRIMIFEEHIPMFLEELNQAYPANDKAIISKAYDVIKIRQTYPNAYRSWPPEDDERLLKLVESGVSTTELAHTFQRNKGAIRSRLKKLMGE